MTMIKMENNEAIQYPRIRPRINWNNLNKETEEKYNIKYLGKVKLKDYKCDLYKYTIVDNGREEEVTNWVYKGIPIQYTTYNNGYELKQEFIKIDEEPKLDKSVFELPKDIKIKKIDNLNQAN